jgi:hypothetical protein
MPLFIRHLFEMDGRRHIMEFAVKKQVTQGGFALDYKVFGTSLTISLVLSANRAYIGNA